MDGDGTTLGMVDLETCLADVLGRVEVGDRFVIERGSEAVAILAPRDRRPVFTWGDVVALMDRLDWPDDRFAKNPKEIRAGRPPATFPERPD